MDFLDAFIYSHAKDVIIPVGENVVIRDWLVFQKKNTRSQLTVEDVTILVGILYVMQNFPVSTWRRFDVYTTSIALKRRHMDVKTTLCAYWFYANLLNQLV